jgi:hypothetical protein
MTDEPGERLWTRRATGLAGLGAVAGAAMSARAAADPLSGQALYADVRTYAGFGEHRTGIAGDEAVTAWLERELRAAGYATERQGFDYPAFHLAAAGLRVGDRSIQAFPVWTPAAGEAAGPLSATPRPGAIVVMRFPYGTGAPLEASAVYRQPVEAAIAAGAAGVAVVTDNPLGELVAYNALPKAPPWPVPVAAVAGREGPALLAAAQAGAAARLRIAGEMRPGRAENVVARRPGPGKPLIVSTPKSGWFTCAGERGSGLAIWLGLARRLAARRDANLVLVAASGHEFDGYGGRLFAEHLAPSPPEARGWVHIGANVASYDFGLDGGRIVRRPTPQAGRRLAVSEALLPAARDAFAGQLGYASPVDVEVQGAPGELAEYQRRGYRPLVGLVGLHPLHHTRRDRPDVTGPELLEPVARGLSAVLEHL